MSKVKREEKHISEYLAASINCLSAINSKNKKIWKDVEINKKMNKAFKNSNFFDDPFSFEKSENIIPKQKINKPTTKNFLNIQKTSNKISTIDARDKKSENLSERELNALKRNTRNQLEKNAKIKTKNIDIINDEKGYNSERALKLLKLSNDFKKNLSKVEFIKSIDSFNELPDLNANDIFALSHSLISLFSEEIESNSIPIVLKSVFLILTCKDSPKIDLPSIQKFEDFSVHSNSIDASVVVLKILQSFEYEEKFKVALKDEYSYKIVSKLLDLCSEYLQKIKLGDIDRLNDFKSLSGLMTVLDDFLSMSIYDENNSDQMLFLLTELIRVLNGFLCLFLDEKSDAFDNVSKEHYCTFYIGMLKLSVSITTKDFSILRLMDEYLDEELMKIGLSSTFSLPTLFSSQFEMELCVLGISLCNNLVENLPKFNPIRILDVIYLGAYCGDNLSQLAKLFEKHTKHALKIDFELNNESTEAESIVGRTRRLSWLMCKASSHMDESLISVYSALLIGCLLRSTQSQKIVYRLKNLLGSLCLEAMVEILKEFLQIINLTVYSDDSISNNVQNIIFFLQSFASLE